MADIFEFYVYDNRSIQFELAEPIMLEDKDVTEIRFRIPKSLNDFDMSSWAWWFIYVNARREKYSIPLTLVDDEDEPDTYSIATFSINYGITGKDGGIQFALEAIDADGSGNILHEWHTRTYNASVIWTLQGNQVEYAEDESDIISALIQQVQTLIARGGIDATEASEGYVPTADGEGGWSWQAQQGGGGGNVVIAHGQLSDLPEPDESVSVPIVLDKTFDELKNAVFSFLDLQLGSDDESHGYQEIHYILLPSAKLISAHGGQNALQYAVIGESTSASGNGNFVALVTPQGCTFMFVLIS